jgi:hypothetical protein
MLVILTSMLGPGYVQSYKGHKNVRTFLKEIAFLGGNDYVTTGEETRLFDCCSWILRVCSCSLLCAASHSALSRYVRH